MEFVIFWFSLLHWKHLATTQLQKSAHWGTFSFRSYFRFISFALQRISLRIFSQVDSKISLSHLTLLKSWITYLVNDLNSSFELTCLLILEPEISESSLVECKSRFCLNSTFNVFKNKFSKQIMELGCWKSQSSYSISTAILFAPRLTFFL